MDFPLAPKLNEENCVRDFINEMDNGISYIDEAGLEEIIEYHQAEFEIIDGHYYNECINNTINHVIKGLYDLIKKLKQENNPSRMVIKLLMSSMYGKTVIKPVDTDTILKDNRADFEKCIPYNYKYIDSVIKVNDKSYIKKLNQSYITLIMYIVVLGS